MKSTGQVAAIQKLNIENINKPVFIVNNKAEFIDVNSAACDHLKYAKNDLLKLNIDLISTNYLDLNWNEIWRSCKKKMNASFETRHISKNGDVYPVIVNARFYNDTREEFIVCVVEDISHIKKIEKNLEEAEELYKIVTEQSNDSVMILNQERVFYINHKTVELSGYKREELLKMSPLFIIHPDDRAMVSELVRRRLRGEEFLKSHTGRIISKTGKVIFLEVTTSKINYKGIPALILNARDVTESLESKERQKENEAMYHKLVENSQEVILILDGSTIVFSNPYATSFFEYSAEELSGMDILDMVHEDDKKQVRKRFADRYAGKPLSQINVGKVVTKSGKIKIIEVTATVVKYNDKNQVVFTGRDITERKKAEEELLLAYKELEKSEKDNRLSKFVIDRAGEAIIMINSYGFITRANDSCKYVWGYSEEEMKYLSIFDIDTELTKAEFDDLKLKVIKKKNVRLEKVNLKKSGEKVPVEISLNSLFFEGEHYITAFVKDISKRKKSEFQLKEAFKQINSLKNKLQAENLYLQDEIKLNHNFEEIITQSKKFIRVLGNVEQVASTDSTVLILGETGTGKELLARAIHNISGRKNSPLVKVNCASLPATLIESELFGYEKGAFTGALTQKIGRFELADGGTIFLDEIGELPLELQPKLLRVLQDGEFERLGNPKTIKVNVRVIAATNKDLKKEAKENRFRDDLFFRLNVFPIRIPSLRERKEDIPILLNHFIKKYSAKLSKKIKTVSQQALVSLQTYDWPGNIREMENVVERAIIISNNESLDLGDWFETANINSKPNKIIPLADYEKEYILKILNLKNWRIRGENGVANALGLKPTTLEAKMKKLGIHRNT
jgi:PAS domain S-box-containing protein